ncbi:MAG TPA: selenide, water dikinase SelD [Acidimicrobiales bacterium]|nr:selenide, water dikinase SelD [Acidimicrobiales bacterium]
MSADEVIKGLRLTQLAPSGGCSGKIPAADLEEILELAFAGGAAGSLSPYGHLLCGPATGDDATVVEVSGDLALVLTTDFFPPVLDDPYDWGRVAAANALSDVYATGGSPVAALNLLQWPTDQLSAELASEVLRGGADVMAEAGCLGAGGHSIRADVPVYGLAVTGIGSPRRLLRNDRARPGRPISLSKPLGLGVLNSRHKQTGEVFPEAVATMTALNGEAARQALVAGIEAATDVTGFGLLGHLYKMARASGVTAVIDAASVAYLEGARAALAGGFVPGGSLRNLEWVRPHLASSVGEDELVLLADAQTSGGLLVAGEIDAATVIGEFIPAGESALIVR